MENEESKPKSTESVLTMFQHWIPPIITAVLGLITGIVLSTYNSGISDNRFFLEKRAIAADNIAKEFSSYIISWNRLIQLRKSFDSREKEPSEAEKENFISVVFNRNKSRIKLFSSFDSVYLYYNEETSNIIYDFRNWDIKQSTLTIDKLSNIQEWRTWQRRILHQLNKEIQE